MIYTTEKDRRENAWYVIDKANDVSICRCGHESDAVRISTAMNAKYGIAKGKAKTKTKAIGSTKPETFMRLEQVREIVPVGRSTLWAWVREGKFPKPVKIGPMTTAWRASDVRVWTEMQAAK